MKWQDNGSKAVAPREKFLGAFCITGKSGGISCYTKRASGRDAQLAER